MQSGIHAARTIKKRLNDGKGSAWFKYRDVGSMAAVSTPPGNRQLPWAADLGVSGLVDVPSSTSRS